MFYKYIYIYLYTHTYTATMGPLCRCARPSAWWCSGSWMRGSVGEPPCRPAPSPTCRGAP